MIYILGNLLGRATASYLIVWVVCWFISRFQWRLALKRSTRWYSLVSVFLLVLMGMSAAVTKQGGLI